MEEQPHSTADASAAITSILQCCEEVVAIFRKAASPRANVRATMITASPEELTECFAFRVDALHRLPQAWLSTFALFRVQVGLYYGDTLIAPMIPLTTAKETAGQSFHTVFWKHRDWVETNSLLYRHLPLETRIVCLVDGATAGNVRLSILGWGVWGGVRGWVVT